jgi:ArsR family transcriptional regulator
LLSLLAVQEMTVAELTLALDLGQSRVSTHLGKLREGGLVRDRRSGAATFYGLNQGGMPEAARRAWELVSGEVSDAVLEADHARADHVIGAREGEALDAFAGRMERHYSPGRTWEALARGLVGLVHLGNVLDVGGGDGTVAELIVGRARSITVVDRSERMIEAARARLGHHPRARVVLADAHELPFADASFDQVLLFHLLTMAKTPARVLAEAARVLRPKGEIVAVTLDAHEASDVTAGYGELHPGFSPAKLGKLLEKAGLEVERCEVTSRERRLPNFRVVTAFAKKVGA